MKILREEILFIKEKDNYSKNKINILLKYSLTLKYKYDTYFEENFIFNQVNSFFYMNKNNEQIGFIIINENQKEIYCYYINEEIDSGYNRIFLK